MPTAWRPGPACMPAANEPRVSASTTCAPPWRIPATCVLPSTGMVATVRSGLISRKWIPILTTRAPTPKAPSQSCIWSGIPAAASSLAKGPGVKLSVMATRLAPVSETTKPAPFPSQAIDEGAAGQRPADAPKPAVTSAAPAAGGSVSATDAPVVPITSQPRLLVLDGHSMAFRAFFALPADKFSTSNGQHTNAIHGFTSMLINLIKEQQPTHIAVAFDVSDESTHRKTEYSEYKGGRNETPREMSGQIDLIGQVMEAWGIKTIKMPGYEADDILATLAAMGEKAGFEVLLVSGDRDAFQLITDNVFVLYPKKGVSDIPRMDAAAIEAKYFVSPSHYSDLAALVGETADNLPGVPGVGPKTAAKWINLYGGLEGVLENIDSIGGKVGDALRGNVDAVKRNRKLNRLRTDLELPVTLEELADPRPDQAALEELFDTLEFKTIRTRLFALYGSEVAEAERESLKTPDFVVPSDAAELDAFLAAGAGRRSAVAVDVVPGRIGEDAAAVAIVRDGAAVYIDLASQDAAAENVLAAWLRDAQAPKVMHGFKAALKALSARGLELEAWWMTPPSPATSSSPTAAAMNSPSWRSTT